MQTCPDCGGEGYIRQMKVSFVLLNETDRDDPYTETSVICDFCGGSGEIQIPDEKTSGD